MTKTTKREKLSKEARKRVSRTIATERRAGMPPKQAVAVAFSIERSRRAKMKIEDLVKKYA